MKTYKANRKGVIRYLVIGFLVLPVLVFFLDRENFMQNPYILLPLLSPALLILWVYFSTSYWIVNTRLGYRSGILKGEIEIATIREIIKGNTLWVGVKPALSTKGLVIKFNRFDEIYIAPESNNQLIADLLEINPDIRVNDKIK